MTPDSLTLRNITLEHTLATIPSGLFVVDKEMRIIYWNPAAERITGFSSAEAVGQPCSFLQGVPCGDGCGLYNPAIAKPIIGADCTIVTKTGEVVQLLKNMDYLRNAAGEIIGGIESFTDVTRQHALEESLRKQAEALEARVKERTAELEQSEKLFRTVLDNMDDLAYIASENYLLTFMNRAMLDFFGDRVGEPCYKVLHDKSSTCSWCPMTETFHQHTVRDERQLGSEGKFYEIVHSPLPDEDGIRRKLAVCRDITERKKAELALREANRELDAFAHSISHDLRGILSPVVTYMDFLRTSYSEVLDDQILQILGEVERQSERAITLLDDLLALAQISHIQPVHQPTDVNVVVAEIVQELRFDNDDIPEIRCDKLPQTWLPEPLVYQIFANLLRNACHYAGKSSGAVEVGSREDGNRLCYFVRDHGPGVSAEETEAVFDIFYRGKSSKGKPGTGVGLAIVRKIALRCLGEAQLEQTPGGGATFCVCLPKKAPYLNPEQSAP